MDFTTHPKVYKSPDETQDVNVHALVQWTGNLVIAYAWLNTMRYENVRERAHQLKGDQNETNVGPKTGTFDSKQR